MPLIKIFRNGKDTHTSLSFTDGIRHWKIVQTGQGCFLETNFDNAKEAELFCREELNKNPADIFYLMDGDLIIDAVLDKKFHEDKRKRSQAIFTAVDIRWRS